MKSLYWKICATFLVVQVVSVLAGVTVFNYVWSHVSWSNHGGERHHGGPMPLHLTPFSGILRHSHMGPMPQGFGPPPPPDRPPPPMHDLPPPLGDRPPPPPMHLSWLMPPPPPPPFGGPPGLPEPMHGQMAQTHRSVLELVAAAGVRLVEEFRSAKNSESELDHQLAQLVAGHPDMIASYISPEGVIHGSAVDWIPRPNAPPHPPGAPDVFSRLQREGFAVRAAVPGNAGYVYIAQEPRMPDFPTPDQVLWYVIQSGASALGAILLVAVLVGFLAFWAIARRLKEVGACLEAAAQGDLVRRVANPGDDEIGRLGECFNRMAQQLAETLARLAAVDERRREFLAHVSHELRTPITSVRANLDTLLVPEQSNLPNSSGGNNTALTHSLEEIDHMACLVEDLLELARMESPRYHLSREEVILQKLVDNMVSRLRTSLQNRMVQVITHYSPEPVRITIDTRRIGQAVTNLLVNAIRSFNEGGTIEVSVSAENGRAVIEIADSGRGIPESVRQRLFEPFQTGTYDGTGLGLTIVRKLIESHGGTIALKPRPGGGTIALVELPLEFKEEPPVDSGSGRELPALAPTA